jgi:hypothetical protein
MGTNGFILASKKSFLHLIEVYGYPRALEIWQKKMQSNDLPTHALTRQISFRWRKLEQASKPKPLPRIEARQTVFEIAVVGQSNRIYLRNWAVSVSLQE